MKQRTTVILWCLAAALVVAFALCVWPTLYRPVAIIPAEGPGWRAARQNRITGHVEWLGPGDRSFRH